MFGSFLQKLFGTHLEVSVPHTKGLPVTDENKFGEEVESVQWIGVDLDGTLLKPNLGKALSLFANLCQ